MEGVSYVETPSSTSEYFAGSELRTRRLRPFVYQGYIIPKSGPE